jgi:hypothetical protein
MARYHGDTVVIAATGKRTVIIYNYGLHEKLISIIIKLRKDYLPEVRRTNGK